MTDKKTLDYFRAAVDNAVLLSDDPVTRNGAVLVSPSGKVYDGANRFVTRLARETAPHAVPVGWTDRIRTDRPFKYAVMQHAEVDACLTAAATGHWGGDLFVLYAACAACARVIAQCGVRRVHTLSDAALGGVPARWREEVDNGRRVLAACGVVLLPYEDLGLRQQFLFDGRMVDV